MGATSDAGGGYPLFAATATAASAVGLCAGDVNACLTAAASCSGDVVACIRNAGANAIAFDGPSEFPGKAGTRLFRSRSSFAPTDHQRVVLIELGANGRTAGVRTLQFDRR
jgi:hypothetical protein